MTAKQIVIRWKPRMWWAYFDGQDTSHLHGASPDELVQHCKAVWPDAEISVDEASRVPAALSDIQAAAARYLHPKGNMSKDEFIDAVLAVADSAKVNKALEGEK